MLVCHCMRVNDRTIRQCVREGARCPEQVAESCYAGVACGGCVPVVEALIRLETQRSEHASHPSRPPESSVRPSELSFDSAGP
jgi:bacterioferritin-associated ferredoxin